MMVRSISSNSRPDTLVQDRILQPQPFSLATRGGPYIWVKMRLVVWSATSPLIPQYQTLDGAGRTAVSAPQRTFGTREYASTARRPLPFSAGYLFQAVSPWAEH